MCMSSDFISWFLACPNSVVPVLWAFFVLFLEQRANYNSRIACKCDQKQQNVFFFCEIAKIYAKAGRRPNTSGFSQEKRLSWHPMKGVGWSLKSKHWGSQ